MGHKVNPFNYRLGYIYSWRSKWFAKKNFVEKLEQDEELRKQIHKRFAEAAIAKIEIQRSANDIAFNIYTSRPGVIIGRGGTGIEDIKKDLKKKLDPKAEIKVNIKEINDPSRSAAILAQSVVEQLERRIPFRRVVKMAIEKAKENGVKGVKISVSGRLDGADMSRRETMSWGQIPLQTLRADIDYVQIGAKTTVGLVGVKVWVYVGEKFGVDNDDDEKDNLGERPGLAQAQPKKNPAK